MIRRREFITLLGAAAAWPMVARAQQPKRLRHIVFLHALGASDPEAQARIIAFRQGLESLGWTENRNIRIEHRFSEGDFGQIHARAEELLSGTPDLIVANSSPAVAALKRLTDTIPIVFSVVNDPVGQGFVASISRPGKNITGFSGKGRERSRPKAPISYRHFYHPGNVRNVKAGKLSTRVVDA